MSTEQKEQYREQIIDMVKKTDNEMILYKIWTFVKTWLE